MIVYVSKRKGKKARGNERLFFSFIFFSIFLSFHRSKGEKKLRHQRKQRELEAIEAFARRSGSTRIPV